MGLFFKINVPRKTFILSLSKRMMIYIYVDISTYILFYEIETICDDKGSTNLSLLLIIEVIRHKDEGIQ